MNILSQAKKAAESHPAKITAKEFLAMVKENPSIFEHWETPLEITEYVDCSSSIITHLSPHLTFSGKNENENTASFYDCKSLKNATGTFHGYVNFAMSRVEEIKALTITQPNTIGWAANFYGCERLQIATGTYPGCVGFGETNVYTIKNLEVQNPEKDGYFADFRNCPKLHNLEGWNLSKKIQAEPKLLAAEKAKAALKKFVKESQPEKLPFL
jgi:hypothetical protein